MVSVQSTLSSTTSKAVSPSAFVLAPIRGGSKRVTKKKPFIFQSGLEGLIMQDISFFNFTLTTHARAVNQF